MDTENLKKDTAEIHAWSRHWDTLFWAVTAFLVSANGALLLYIQEQGNFKFDLGILGLVLTFFTVFFAAGFRSFRSRLYNQLPDDEKIIVRGGGLFSQWWPYTIIFVIVSSFWTYKLYVSVHEWRAAFIGACVVIAIVFVACEADKNTS